MEKKGEEIVRSADFGNLPDVALLKIFSYLTTYELCLARRVCAQWLRVSRSASLWKSVDLRHIQLSSEQIQKLFRSLPSNTNYLRIYRLPSSNAFDSLFRELDLDPDEQNLVECELGPQLASKEKVPQFSWLQNRCEYLQTLIMDGVVLNDSELFDAEAPFATSCLNTHLSKRGVWNLPLQVRVLSVRRCQVVPSIFFPGVHWSNEIVLKIEVLDCTKCMHFADDNIHSLEPSRLPFLQELYLAGCIISDYGVKKIATAISGLKVLDIEMTKVSCYSFRILNEFSKHLEQLFIGGSEIKGEGLRRVQPGSLPSLKIICLKGIRTSLESRRTLISLLPALQYMNGIPSTRVLSEELPNEYCRMCDHFLLREKDFDV